MASNEQLLKTLTTLAPSTGDHLINTEVEKEIHDIVYRSTPILANLTRRNWSLPAYTYRSRLTDPDSFFLADNEAMPSPDAGTFEDKTVLMKYLYANIAVSGPLQAATADWINILADQIESAGAAVARKLQNTVLFGNASSNPKEFDGLTRLITTNAINVATHGLGGGSLVLMHIEELLDTPEATPNRIVTIKKGGRRINSLLQAQQRFVNTTTVDGGFEVPTYRGVPILVMDGSFNSTDLEDTVFAYEHSRTRLVVQQDPQVQPLAKTHDADNYMVKMYATLAVLDENWHAAKLTNVDFDPPTP